MDKKGLFLSLKGTVLFWNNNSQSREIKENIVLLYEEKLVLLILE